MVKYIHPLLFMSKEVTTACQPKVCPGQLQSVSWAAPRCVWAAPRCVWAIWGKNAGSALTFFTMVNVGFRVLHLQTLNIKPQYWAGI